MKPGITMRLPASTTAAASAATAMSGRTSRILPSSISTSARAKSPTARSSVSTTPPLSRIRRCDSRRPRSGSSAWARASPISAGAAAPSTASPAPDLRTRRREYASDDEDPTVGSELPSTRSRMADLVGLTSGLADQHGGDPGQDRQRNRDCRAQPHHPRRHHVNFPVDQPLDRIERPGRRIGDHLRGTGAALERRRSDRETDHRATGRRGAARRRDGDADEPGIGADPVPDQVLRHHRRDITGADHADEYARNQHDEVAQTVEGALAEQGLAAHRGGERERGDQAPQDDADDDADDVNQVHWSPPPRAAIARAAVRAIRPAMIGSGSAIKMRQPTNSGPKNGSSQMRARL